jgi:hypothetical protein
MIVQTQQEVLNLEKIALNRSYGFNHKECDGYFEVDLQLKVA